MTTRTNTREASPAAGTPCPTCNGPLCTRPALSRHWSAWDEAGRIGPEPPQDVCSNCGSREAILPYSVLLECRLVENINSPGGES